MPTPLGYCDVFTIRPISASPLAVVVTGLEQDVAVPALGPAGVETSSCFHTTVFVAGLNATRRAIVSAVGGTDDLHCMTPVSLLPEMTGCWSVAGGDSTRSLWMFAQTTSVCVCGSKD